jgi:hypothetical protein
MFPLRCRRSGRTFHAAFSNAVAAEAYRTGALTAHQAGQLLGHTSRWETEAFLKRMQAYLHYSDADLARDLENLRAARGR